MIKFCKRGHAYTLKNTRWYTHSANGKSYRTCRRCISMRVRLKYRHDDAWREKEKLRARLAKAMVRMIPQQPNPFEDAARGR